MSANAHKLLIVKDCIANGDIQLGQRRLIDCVMDTRDKQFYKRMLDILDAYDKNSGDFESQSSGILESLGNFKFNPKKIDIEKPLLEVRDLAKQYRSSAFRISPVSFTLNYGDVVGLVGENGNGKTTLLRLLCKDLEPDNVSLNYNLHSPSSNLYQLRSKLIYIPQRIPRWFGTLMDNLQFTLALHGIKNDENELRTELIIARLGLRPYKHLNWQRISSGYRTRFELAKSLLRQPDLMLLDEPLSNLDIISQQTILQDLKSLSESLVNPFGLVLSSQQLYEVEKISNLVVFLKKGDPKYQLRNRKNVDENPGLIFELETETAREELLKIFEPAGLIQLQFNGGVYIMHFREGTLHNEVFLQISNNRLPVNYIRNITFSSRRFFIN